MGKERTNKSKDLGLLPVEKTLPILLVRAREVLLSFWRDALVEMDFTEQQWRVLRVTAEFGPLDISHLSNETALHMPSVTRILQGLEKRGYISRRRDETDSRRSWIEITEKTRIQLTEVGKKSDAIYAEILRSYDSRKMDELIQLLKEFTEIRDPS